MCVCHCACVCVYVCAYVFTNIPSLHSLPAVGEMGLRLWGCHPVSDSVGKTHTCTCIKHIMTYPLSKMYICQHKNENNL